MATKTKSKSKAKPSFMLKTSQKFGKWQITGLIILFVLAGTAFILFTHAAAAHPVVFDTTKGYVTVKATDGRTGSVECPAYAISAYGEVRYCAQLDRVYTGSPLARTSGGTARFGLYDQTTNVFSPTTGFLPLVGTFEAGGYETCPNGYGFVGSSTVSYYGNTEFGAYVRNSGGNWQVEWAYYDHTTNTCAATSGTWYNVINVNNPSL